MTREANSASPETTGSCGFRRTSRRDPATQFCPAAGKITAANRRRTGLSYRSETNLAGETIDSLDGLGVNRVPQNFSHVSYLTGDRHFLTLREIRHGV